MRKIVAGLFQSMDGVVQSPGGPEEDADGGFEHGGWVMPHFDETVAGFMGEVFAGPFDLLLGRRTYDVFAGHWPKADADPTGAKLNRAAKFVVTRGAGPLAWERSHALADVDAVEALKRTDGPDLVVQGSGTLYPELLARDLIDRLFLVTFPIVLGTGKRAFDGAPAGGFRLVEHRVSGTGVIVGVYEPAGALETRSIPAP